MSMRVDDGHNSSPDDDWFAPSGQPTLAREDPSPQSDAYDHEPEWDANVGARMLYKLCGLAR